MDPLQDQYGLQYYPEQPPGTKVATPQDLSNISVLSSRNTPFLILGWHWPVYQLYRMQPGFTIDKILPWLNAGRVFIFTGQTA